MALIAARLNAGVIVEAIVRRVPLTLCVAPPGEQTGFALPQSCGAGAGRETNGANEGGVRYCVP